MQTVKPTPKTIPECHFVAARWPWRYLEIVLSYSCCLFGVTLFIEFGGARNFGQKILLFMTRISILGYND